MSTADTVTVTTVRSSFRVWLKDKYKTLDAVNDAWNTEVLGTHLL